MECTTSTKPLKWGFVSAGKITHDFCTAMMSLDKSHHKLVAVASRSISTSKQFAKTHNIETAYGTYEELAKDENIDIVYIGSIHTEHKVLSEIMLTAGKHVLCEKPMGTTSFETKEILSLAKEKGLFFMEGLWTRCFPCYDKLREILSSGKIGDVKLVMANFGIPNGVNIPRLAEKNLAGGALLDVGIYVIQLATLVFGYQQPLSITAQGFLTDKGVDESGCIILTYPNNCMAVLNISILLDTSKEAFIYGTQGKIKIHAPFWCPTSMTVEDKRIEIFEFPFPEAKGNFHFINSIGLLYEAESVRNCISKGKCENPAYPHKESLLISEIIEKSRHSLGYFINGYIQEYITAIKVNKYDKSSS